MRSLPLLRVLRSTAAVGAIALGSASANAACTTANGVVTCTGVNTVDQVNFSLNTAPPPSVTLVIARDATVTRNFSSFINTSAFRFPGAVGYTNSGTVGTSAANVTFGYFGTPTTATNTFTLNNAGVQNGGIFATDVGGAINGTNSGTVTGGIDLRGAGPITFANTGNVFNTNFFGSSNAITLTSSRVTSVTGTDGITRSTETGGPVTATIGGTVGVPASGSSPFRAQGVFARSVGGVDVTANGTAGTISAQSAGTASERRFTFVNAGGSTTQTQLDDSRTIGGNARVTVGTDARLENVSVASGPGSATAIINGTITSPNSFGFSNGVNVSAFGTDRTFARRKPAPTLAHSHSTTLRARQTRRPVARRWSMCLRQAASPAT